MSVTPVNYFSHATAAERYARFRPYFHPLIAGRLVRFTGCARFKNVLDVACGTGNSARALADIADQVTGLDSSAAMLAQAPVLPNVTYQAGSAEALPFAEASFDLLTVVMAFHWFDQGRFLSEARRVLQPRGWLLLYNNVLLGGMKENPAFKHWVGLTFLPRYHTPPRARKKVTASYAGGFGFELAGRENTFNEIVMTPEQLTGYFLTQSNVIAAVEQGSESLEEVAAWIAAGVRPFFAQPTATMQFGSDIFYLRRRE
ncbi:MAG TPA: methyltransferase domain-containing protein [Opitutales bacterium]|nr:methyltransferase domain-containing protein [Opitutales bacterium]